MVEITPLHDTLALEVKGLHKLWALKSRLEVPLDHIKGVQADPNPAMGWFQGVKIVGTDVPNVFRAGMFRQDKNRVFWDVRHAEKTIVLDLEDEFFAQLIIEVKDPETAVRTIRQTLERYHAAKAAAEAELEQSLKGPSAPTVGPVSTRPVQEDAPQTVSRTSAK